MQLEDPQRAIEQFKDPIMSYYINQEFKRDAISNINFGVSDYGRLKYLMRMTELRKKDKRLEALMAQPNISEKKTEQIKKERA